MNPTQPVSQTPQNFNPTSVQDLINAGLTGYQGWNDNAAAIQNFKETGGQGKGVLNIGGGTTTPEIDAINRQITDRQTALSKAQLGINDNPFYSEATRVGKLRSLQDQYNADITPLNTQLKTLTEAYNTKIKAEADSQKTTLKTFTDNDGNTVAITLDSKGNEINRTSLGNVGKGKTPAKGKVEKPEKLTPDEKAMLKQNIAQDAKDGNLLEELVAVYTAYGMDLNTIYTIYGKNSPYGAPVETLQQVSEGRYSTQPAPAQPVSGRSLRPVA
jgi:hypothetical protein